MNENLALLLAILYLIYRFKTYKKTNKIIEEKKITTLMVTHNIKQAIESGNRLIMMHEGKTIIDVSKEEKAKLNRDRLIEMFGKVNMEDVLSDRSLLSTF